MSAITNQLGLNITEEKLQLVELNYTENSCYLENIDEEYFEELITADTKEAKFIYILQNAFNEIILRNPINSIKVSVSLPLSFFNTFEIPAEQNLTSTDFDEYLEWEFSKLYPGLFKESFTIQSHVAATNKNNENLNAFVYIISKSTLKIIHKFCVRNNLQLKNVDNSHIASTAFLQLKQTEEKQLSIFIDNHRISIILYSGNKFLYYKQKEHKSISEIPLLAKDIYDEIKERYLKFDNPTTFILFGNIHSEKLKDDLEKTLELTAQTINPFEKIKTATGFSDNKFYKESPLKFSSATGMALRLVS
jgi:Tfp pilus assembly PilM family ATPase